MEDFEEPMPAPVAKPRLGLSKSAAAPRVAERVTPIGLRESVKNVERRLSEAENRHSENRTEEPRYIEPVFGEGRFDENRFGDDPPDDYRRADAPPKEKAADMRQPEGRRSDRTFEKRARATLDERMASLAHAMRRARMENAEHSSSAADVRAAEIARLELLADELAPVLAQTPGDVDIFDVAIAPGERPRLFIDQIGFVEMDRDRRTYRFLQDTRHGRVTLCESDNVETIVDAATTYMAHRLIEREKALAADYASGGPTRAIRETVGVSRRRDVGLGPISANWKDRVFPAFLFFVEFLGSAAFFGLLLVLALWAWNHFSGK